jgi:hypothetical protein
MSDATTEGHREMSKAGGTATPEPYFGSEFNRPEGSDFCVVASGTAFHLHRLVLKRRSNMFAAMLNGGFEEAMTSQMVIDNFPAVDVETALRWMYTNEVNLTAANLLGELRVGEYMQLDEFVQQCRDAAKNVLTVETVIPILNAVVAEPDPDPVVRAICLDVWAGNTASILQQSNFSDLSLDALFAFLSHDFSNCEEDELLDGTIDWLAANGYDDCTAAKEYDDHQLRPGLESLDEPHREVAMQLLSLFRVNRLRPEYVMKAVDLASRASHCMPATLVDGLRHHLMQSYDGAAEPHAIEALSSTDEDTELSPVALQHGIRLLLLMATSNPTVSQHIVNATWDQDARVLYLEDITADFMLFPFLYCGRWRLFILDCRGTRSTLYAFVLNEKVARPPLYDCRRAHECVAAMRRHLERVLGTGEVIETAHLGWLPLLQNGEYYPSFTPPSANFPDTGTGVLEVLATLFGTTAPTRQQLRDSILGQQCQSSQSSDTPLEELTVHRALHHELSSQDGPPARSTTGRLRRVRLSNGLTDNDEFTATANRLVRLGIYRLNDDGGYAL